MIFILAYEDFSSPEMSVKQRKIKFKVDQQKKR